MTNELLISQTYSIFIGKADCQHYDVNLKNQKIVNVPWHVIRLFWQPLAYPKQYQVWTSKLDKDAAKVLIGNGVKAVVESANMPATAAAKAAFASADILFGPGIS